MEEEDDDEVPFEILDLEDPHPDERCWDRVLACQKDDARALFVLKMVRDQWDTTTRVWSGTIDTPMSAKQYRRIKRYLRLRLEHLDVHLSARMAPYNGLEHRFMMDITIGHTKTSHRLATGICYLIMVFMACMILVAIIIALLPR